MTTYIEIHALRAFPPSNLNRDDFGAPKSAMFGGSKRLRISSQCLKRTWRLSEQFQSNFTKNDLSIRTNQAYTEVTKQITNQIGQLNSGLIDGITSLIKSIGKSEDKDKDKKDSTVFLFLTKQEIDLVCKFIQENETEVNSIKSSGKVDKEVMNKVKKNLKKYLLDNTDSNSPDVGLFGRFITTKEPEFDTINAALQVSHAVGVTKMDVEYDYFTTIDDISTDPGAAHLGESEFSSSVMYMYSVVDLNQLEKNLGMRTSAGRKADAESISLARKSIPALIRAVGEATPTGKKTGTAPYTKAEYIEVIVRKSQPFNSCNAFLKPVHASEANGDIMLAAINKLIDYKTKMEAAYNSEDEVIARFSFCTKDLESGKLDKQVASIKALVNGLTSTLENLPVDLTP